MHLLITDSGVGGLSVCAHAERFAREQRPGQPLRLTFANAAPSNEAGYNAMPTREQKIETFDRFLRCVSERYTPDLIYVACNTLSVLLADTPQAQRGAVPVQGIVERGARRLAQALHAAPHAVALVFGTQTTIDAGTYPRLLVAQGIAAGRIVSQACPGLADTISEDPEGARSGAEIARWVRAALDLAGPHGREAIAYLACTHYGYRREQFAEALAAAGVRAQVVNPNEEAVHDLFPAPAAAPAGRGTSPIEIEVVSRYRIPQATLEALGGFLGSVSPATVAAMHRHTHRPDLF